MVDTGSPLLFLILRTTSAMMTAITKTTPSVHARSLFDLHIMHAMITNTNRTPATMTMMSQRGVPGSSGTSISVSAGYFTVSSHQLALAVESQNSSSSPPASPSASLLGHSWMPSHLREPSSQLLPSLQQNLCGGPPPVVESPA